MPVKDISAAARVPVPLGLFPDRRMSGKHLRGEASPRRDCRRGFRRSRMLATTLRYAYEVRDQGAYFEDIPELKLPAEMIKLASHIIDSKAGHFDPKKFEDHYETALVELLRKKQ